MSEKVYKTISKEEYERLKSMSWETAQGELFYRTTGIRRYWRPSISWLYFCICAVDLLLLPVFWYTIGGQGEYKPYTLTTPVFHLSMGAIVGAAAVGRSWEKIDQYKFDQYNYGQGYGYDPYHNPNVPYPGSPPVMMPPDNVGDALSQNEDEIIPDDPRTK